MIEDEGGTALVVAADCTSNADCEAMVAAAVDAFGTVDVLVNNIGLAALGTVVDTTGRGLGPGPRHQPHCLPRLRHAVPVMAAQARARS